VTGAKVEDLGLLRDDDSDDVRWALQTASVQMARGGPRDAVVWIERAAEAAEQGGNEWRAAELRAHARALVGSGRPSMPSIPVEVEEVELDELLDQAGGSYPPSPFAQSPAPRDARRRAPSSAPPLRWPQSSAVVSQELPPSNVGFAQGGGFQANAGSAQNAWGAAPKSGSVPPKPRASQPPPLPGQLVGYGPGNWPSQAGFSVPGSALGVQSAPVRPSSVPPALPGSLPHVRNDGISPVPVAVSYRPGSLAQRTEIAFPGAARVQQPSAPSLSGERTSWVSHAVPPNPFAPAAAARADFQHTALRAPMGSSPDLEVNEVDLDEAGIDLISLGPGSLRASRNPSGLSAYDRATGELEEPAYRASSMPPSQDLSHLYADEEVLDESERDRLSDLTLDTFDFTAAQSERNPSGPPSLRSSQLPPVPETGDSTVAAEGALHSAPAWVTPTRAAASDAPPVLSTRSSAPPSVNGSSRSTPPPAPTRTRGPASSGPDSAPQSHGSPRSKPPVLVRKSSGAPAASARLSGETPSRQERTTARPAASARPPEPWAPNARPSSPERLSSNPPPSSISSLPTLMPAASTKKASAVVATSSARVDGVELGEARGFEDLPREVQLRLAECARVETLGEGEEVAFFGAAVVTHGAVDILPAISDEAGAVAHQGDVVFTIGTLPEAMPLRVVAKLEKTRVAVWDRETLNDAIAECPWVHDDLHQIADRFLACCGATLGALGERLDGALRGAVYSRFDVASYASDEVLVSAGEPVPKLVVVGGGKLELVNAAGDVIDELGPGEFLFPGSILSAGKAPHTARAGSGGVLVLQASRAAAHELFMSVPPLLEILAS
jgi:hypothetical protein